MMFRFSVLTCLVILCSSIVAADSLTAEFQTRLKLADENPGPIDGAFGNKTNSAANRYFSTDNVNYKSRMREANEKLKQTYLRNIKQNKDLIFTTTSDYLESTNTTVFLKDDDKIWNTVRQNFDERSGGAFSKWYQADITGDGTPDLVIFGMGPDFQAECEIKNCGDEWLKKPVAFELKDNPSDKSYDVQLLDNNKIFPGDIFSRGTGGKTIFADFNNDGFDDFYIPSEGPVKGPKIHLGGRDVLLMSNGDGTYRDDANRYDLLKKRSFQHWTAAGDIDNDGDIDFIFHNLIARTSMGDKISCFINDGKGNFTVKNCVDAPKAKVSNRYNSWGGTLFDLNGDNILDLWLSRNHHNKPVIILGDGTGEFPAYNSIEV